ncbi:MAG: T9SS type A sorting domain-containing protein [Candidatus Marinimicrobia bacterium]|nr:T9SS type A sorting domain-containing protein [Candidatus Neomarinimicrobiota bacterium]MCF7905269.1 T9SS type A sorting domain-containing protein [Candidatus Neomarinimicrobiota bacterium]
MIFKNKTISVALSLMLLSAVVFGAAPELSSASYHVADNQLVLVFSEDVQLDNVLLGLISFDDDDGGPVADLTLENGGIHNPNGLTANDTVIIDLLYGDIVDSFTGSYYGDNAYVFDLWGTNVSQVQALEAMASATLDVHLEAGAFISTGSDMSAMQSIDCAVTADATKPQITSAAYDANINTLSIVFDKDVQFDRIAEDRATNGGPGNGILQNPIGNNDPGEDRNGNGVLEFESNINPFRIGLVGSLDRMTLENIEDLRQTMDNDTMDIVLTSNDAKKLESKVGLSNLNLDVREWAFVDTNYNPNLASDAAVTVTTDSVNFVSDSASYDQSKNILSIYFSNLMDAGRTVSLSPAPVYTKMVISSDAGSHILNGVEGNPSHIAGYDNTAFKFKLPIPDQAGVEKLLDGSNVTLAISSFALYDNFDNGNADMVDVPVNITSTAIPNEQPPVLTASSYDVDTHTLTLTWDLILGVGFYNGEALTVYDNAISQALNGIELYDSVADSTITLGDGMVYFSGSKKNTYIELPSEDAIRLETYENLASLTTYLDRDIFNAFLYLNGNAAIGASDAIAFDVVDDVTPPEITSAQLNVFTETLTLGTNEPVDLADVSLADFTLAGIAVSGALINDDELDYASEFDLELDENFFTSFNALTDSVRINPTLEASAAALTNISGLTSASASAGVAVGRNFFLRSFEAFAPPPATRFGALKLIGNDCDIYVDDEMWDAGKVTAANLDSLQKAFESSTPVDAGRGIKAIVDELYGGILDTDDNGKVVIFLADILDEYDLGRNDTQNSYFENGYITMVDTSDSFYSNNGDIIYLDVDPQIIGTAPYTEWDESMLNALTYQYSLLSATVNKPDQERWINYGVALKMQEQTVGDIKFFGDGVSTASTANNELTYIATSLLKSRNDLFNVYNFFTYLTEKYQGTTSSFDIISNIAQSDVIGTATIDSVLSDMGFEASGAQAFQNYAVACFLDMNQASTTETGKYNGLYNFEALDLYGAPGGKNAGNLPWDAAGGKAAPYPKAFIQPWSFNFYVARSYFIDIAGNFNIVSPDLDGNDTLVFDGYDGIQFKASKILLHSGYLDPMTQDFEVVDFDIDDETSRGMLPMTTDSNFEFRATFPDTAKGVQLLAMVVSKTDYAPPPPSYDFVITNVTTKPEFGDFYAIQNPNAENYLDLFVVSERPIYNLQGIEGATAKVIMDDDTSSLEMPLLDSYDAVVSVYSGNYTITEEGNYSFVFSGQDQNGISFNPVTQNISIGMAKPAQALSMELPDGMGKLNVPARAVSTARYIVAGKRSMHQHSGDGTAALPEGIQAVSDVITIGHAEIGLNREASLSLTYKADYANQSDHLGVYLLQGDEWTYIGGTVDAESMTLQVNTDQLGKFVIALGDHPEEELNLPDVLSLEQNFPNPFNPTTTIAFSLPDDASVQLKVFNMLGQEVATLADGYFQEGRHELMWNAHDRNAVRVASGVYFYAIESGDMRLVKKMLILK